MSRPLERVLERLERVGESSSGYQARCPAHEDRAPSLSISEGTDGRVLLHCHAGCSAASVVEALGLRMQDLYPEAVGGDGAVSLPELGDEATDWDFRRDGEPVETYTYTDAEGEELFKVVRFEPEEGHPMHGKDKTFRPCHHDPLSPKANAKGYVMGRGTDPVLYRLPKVEAAREEGRRIYVGEGEKVVHVLEELGLIATTSPGGSKGWRDELGEPLAGAEVVVLPDNDAPGEGYAQAVAQSCHARGASVKVLRLPGLPSKGDAVEWIEAGGTRAKLEKLADETEPYVPEGAGPKGDARSEEVDVLALEDAPFMPEEVFNHLPPMLLEATLSFDEPHERGVFLTGALPVLAGAMPQVMGYYGHNAQLLAPSFYAAVVAGAAGGKGPLRWAERLVRATDEYLRERSERAQAQWEEERVYADENGEPFHEPRPPKESLILPANTSAAAFHKALADRSGRAVVIETEIDTLVNALGQEWGKFDDTLRKAFHHERVSYLRKEEEASIDQPELALVLSGTPAQMRRLIGSSENGLYSRMALFYFEAPPRWIDQRPTDKAREREERFEVYAKRVRKLYETLAARPEPLWFTMEDAHWEQHRETFSPMLQRAYAEGAGHLDDVIKRAGVVSFRVAMTACVLRSFERGADLGRAKTLTASDDDVMLGLGLACLWADHALRFARTLPKQEELAPQAQRVVQFLAELPEEFTNEEVYELAERLGWEVSRRTLQRDLGRAAKKSLLFREGKSKWRKA